MSTSFPRGICRDGGMVDENDRHRLSVVVPQPPGLFGMTLTARRRFATIRRYRRKEVQRIVEMTHHRHGGDVRRLAAMAGVGPQELLDFSANINPLGFPEGFQDLMIQRLQEVLHYPDPTASGVVAAIADRYGVPPEEIVVGNGSTELLYALPRALPRSRAVIPVPSYGDYAAAAALAGAVVEKVLLAEEKGFHMETEILEGCLRGDETVYIGRPNNPTGLISVAAALRETASRHPESVFVIDEAFADFVDGLDRFLVRRPPNVVVLCSLTKFYAIPGLRLGFAVGPAALIDRIRRFVPPWSVNSLAQAAGEVMLGDDDYRRRTIALVTEQRRFLSRALRAQGGFHVYPGEANFLLVKLMGADITAPALAAALLKKKIAIRCCDSFTGLDRRFFRIAVRKRNENEMLIAALREIMPGYP